MLLFPRRFGSNARNGSFDAATLRLVFNKGAIAPGLDPERFRLDRCGALMDFHLHGDTTPDGAGWEVDHIVPVAHGGSDALFNLQPLQWQHNRYKSDGANDDRFCDLKWTRR